MSVVVGLVLVVFGACLKWAIFPAVVNSMISSNLQLTPDNTEAWDAWVSIHVIVIFSSKICDPATRLPHP